jgi:hypothetical protein
MSSPAIKDVISQSHRELLSADEQEYQKTRAQNWDFFMGRMGHTDYWPQRIAETPEAYNERLKNKVTLAITSRAVDALVDNVYGLGVERRFPKDDDASQAAIDDVLRWVGGQNFFCEKLQTSTEVAGTCAVVPRFDPITRRITLDTYSGEYVTVRTKPGSHEVLEGFEIEFQQARTVSDQRVTRTYYERWDRNEFEVRWGSDTLMSGPNPYYPELPIVRFIARHNPQSWYGWTPIDAVVDANVVLNDYLTDFRQIVKKHGYPTPVFIGTEIQELSKSPGLGIALPPGEPGERVDAKYLIPGGPFKELLEFFDWWVQWIANQANVPVQLINVVSGSAESGYALSIRWKPFLTGLERKRRLYRESERALWRLVFKMMQFHAGREGGVDGGHNPDPNAVDDLVIDFGEGVVPEDPRTVMEREEHDLELGLTSPVKLKMKREPGLSAEEAEQELRSDIELRDELRALGAKVQEDVLNRVSGEME